MTTPPRPNTTHAPEKPQVEGGKHESKTHPEPEDREKQPFDDPNQKTIQEEQLERSAEIEKEGIAKWVADHDERKPEERDRGEHGKAVPGVSPTQKDETTHGRR